MMLKSSLCNMNKIKISYLSPSDLKEGENKWLMIENMNTKNG